MKTRLIEHATLPTTMLEAKAQARLGAEEGTTILAHAQTSGRGRLGRSWTSDPDTGVWMTMILRPPPERMAGAAELSLVAGLAVCKSVHALGVTAARLKWPNDILVGDRKLAGILLELDGDVVLVGVGLNLAKAAGRTLPEDVAARYTGILDHVAAPWETAKEPTDTPVVYTCRTLMRELTTWYDRWKAHGFSELTQAYQELDALRDVTVRVAGTDGTEVVGTARGVNAQGELRVETSRGIVDVRAGEVERVRR